MKIGKLADAAGKNIETIRYGEHWGSQRPRRGAGIDYSPMTTGLPSTRQRRPARTNALQTPQRRQLRSHQGMNFHGHMG